MKEFGPLMSECIRRLFAHGLSVAIPVQFEHQVLEMPFVLAGSRF